MNGAPAQTTGAWAVAKFEHDSSRPVDAGLRTARLDEIIRQKDPALKEAVEQLARGEVREAINNLNQQGRVHEVGDRHQRIGEIAREYVRQIEPLVMSSEIAGLSDLHSFVKLGN